MQESEALELLLLAVRALLLIGAAQQQSKADPPAPPSPQRASRSRLASLLPDAASAGVAASSAPPGLAPLDTAAPAARLPPFSPSQASLSRSPSGPYSNLPSRRSVEEDYRAVCSALAPTMLRALAHCAVADGPGWADLSTPDGAGARSPSHANAQLIAAASARYERVGREQLSKLYAAAAAADAHHALAVLAGRDFDPSTAARLCRLLQVHVESQLHQWFDPHSEPVAGMLLLQDTHLDALLRTLDARLALNTALTAMPGAGASAPASPSALTRHHAADLIHSVLRRFNRSPATRLFVGRLMAEAEAQRRLHAQFIQIIQGDNDAAEPLAAHPLSL